MRAQVDGKLSCGRFSLVVRKTNWVLSLIQLADVRGSELACACAGTIPEPGQSRGASNLLIHGDRQQCQRGTPATCDARGADHARNVDTADFVGPLYSTIKLAI
jgi:hypothetical protein